MTARAIARPNQQRHRQPGYRLFDVCGQDVTPKDTEDKAAWITSGAVGEQQFLALCHAQGILPGLAGNRSRIRSGRMWEPEFVYEGQRLDVKVQTTPLFTACRQYLIPPRYAVTLNVQDVLDIRRKYPDCLIAFWVCWEAVRIEYLAQNGSARGGSVIQPLQGVWLVTPDELLDLAEDAYFAGRIHTYQRRVGDRVNATRSFVFDVRGMNALWVDPACVMEREVMYARA